MSPADDGYEWGSVCTLSCSASPTRPRRSSCASVSRWPTRGRCAWAASCSTCDGVAKRSALSTCNRTELYMYGRRLAGGRRGRGPARWPCAAGVSPPSCEPASYSYSGDGAIAHLFRVAASLDSHGGRRGADPRPAQGRLPGGLRGRLHQRRLQPALPPRARGGQAGAHRDGHRRAPGERQLGGRGSRPQVFGRSAITPCSSSAPARPASSPAHAPQGARHREILVTNRTPGARRELLARRVRRRGAVPFEELETHLAAADIVISSTAAPALRRHARAGGRALMAAPPPPAHLLIDIAVPRDLDPSIDRRARRLPLRHRRPAAAWSPQNRHEREKEASTPSASSPRSSDSMNEWLRGLRGGAHHRQAARSRG